MAVFITSPTSGFQEIDQTADWAYRVWADNIDCATA
ncbi:hypothetical protein N836_06980 [Leptolyngbya sp. Heron Island J]|nr:hypothetical protein N836_06980 [Leptolyngbya sp. Heron Island J]